MQRPLSMATLALVVFAFSAGADGFVIRPYIQHVTPGSATILWETREAGPGAVAFGPTAALGKWARDDGDDTLHRVRLEGLTPASPCHYRVSVGEETHQSVFRTAPEGPAPVTFVVLGGTADWPEDLWQRTGMADHAAQWAPDFYVHTGNMVADGRDLDQWPRHFARFADTLANVWMVPVRGAGEGKRAMDTKTVTSQERPADMQAFMREALAQRKAQKEAKAQTDGFARYFSLPGEEEAPAAFGWGDARFVLLSPNDAAHNGGWFADAMAEGGVPNTVVVQHPAMYTAGSRSATDGSRAEAPAMLHALREAMEKHDVVLNIAGQARVYERSFPLRDGVRDARTGVTYVTQGGTMPGAFPAWYTAVGPFSLAAPAYTVVHFEGGSGWLRAFAWDKDTETIVEHDYHRFSQDGSEPAAILAGLNAMVAQDLPDAVEALGAYAYGPAVKALIPMLEDAEPGLRRRVVWALRRIGSPAAAEALLTCVRDADPVVRREAARGIEIAMDPALSHAVAAVVLDAQAGPEVRAALLGALAAHAPFYFALDAAERILRQQDAPPMVRSRAAWVADRVATEDDVPILLSLVVAERETYPLLRLGHALDRICNAQTDLSRNGPLASSALGEDRAPFIMAWEQALSDFRMRETQQDKREAFDNSRNRWQPAARPRAPLGTPME